MAELLKVREITIDTMQHKDFATKEEELKVMRFYQNDLNSAKLLINVTHDKVVTDFSTATKVQIAFLKPDGKRVFQDVQNVNQMQGKYYVVLSTQTLIAYGNVVAQLRLTFPDNKVIETCKFVFAVDESIMSDEAMKSTNEFPVIQKAIEAGEKLEGVDINGIIAAGVKADGALPKSGGTMTGPLELNSNTLLRFKGETGKRDWLFYRKSAQDSFVIAPRLADGSDWDWNKQIEFRPDNFIVNGGTNLVKKTGDTMTGHLKFNRDRGIAWNDGVKDIHSITTGGDNKTYFTDGMNGVDYAIYDPTTKSFNILQNTNLLKKTGDVMAGLITNTSNDPMSFRPAGDNPWWLVNTSQGTLKFIPSTTNGQADWNWGKVVWISKDGLIRQGADTDWTTVTADVAVQALSGGIQAKRSGNVVNLTIGVKALQALSAKTIATLPATFRPQKTINQTYISEQGTANNVWVTSAGAIAIHMPIDHSAYINLTYVI
ncbi:phage baseplate upper protein [Bacillus paranthracis]|nr:phage baseplate upper protein [Bacillus paranthracis]MCU5611997.1 phage baseplate upper protein [Bacillus paranthracis]